MQEAKSFNLSKLYLGILAVFAAGNSFAAANFSINPSSNYPMPNMVNVGNMVFAYYNITNNTHSIRTNYSIQGLPSSVVQDTSSSSYCPNPMTLASKQSCLLKLNISGQVINNFALCKGTSCTSAPEALNVTQVLSLPFVAAGNYQNTSLQTLPLAYISGDAGQNWSLNTNFTIPSDSISIPSNNLLGINCDQISSQNCVIVGAYQQINSIANQQDAPLGYRSTNGGQSWSLIHFILPPDATEASSIKDILYSVSCDKQGLNCYAVGNYASTTIYGLPLGYSSVNGGLTWSLINFIPPSDIIGIGASQTPNGLSTGLHGISCNSNGTTCTTVGTYVNIISNSQPLGYTSINSGVSWTPSTFPIPADAYGLAGFQRVGLNSISCDKNTGMNCTAVGTYITSNQSYLPLAYTSKNGGLSWTVSNSLPIPNDVDQSNSGQSNLLNSVSCDKSGQFCVAVGYYQTASAQIKPLTYNSINGGASWSLSSSTLPSPNNAATSTYFYGVYCDSSASLCNAVGFYTLSTGESLPLSYVSNTGGTSWTLSSTLPLPANVGTPAQAALAAVG